MSFTVEQPSTSPGAEQVKCTAVYGWVFGLGVGFLFPRVFRFAASPGKKTAFSKAQRTCRSPALFDVSESHHLSRMIYFIAMFYLILYPSSTSSSPEKHCLLLESILTKKKERKAKKKGEWGDWGISVIPSQNTAVTLSYTVFSRYYTTLKSIFIRLLGS